MSQENYFFDVLYLIPAYNRKYNTAELALADWYAGKDFKIDCGGSYCSIRDIAAMKEQFGEIRLLYSFIFPSIKL